MTLLAFLLVSPVLVFGGGSPEPTATAQLSSALRLDSDSPSQDESVEVLIIRSSCKFFGGCPTSGCLDSNTLTMKSCSETNPHGTEKKSDCQKKCGSFHLIKYGSDDHAHCTLGVGGGDAAYLSIGQDPGASAAKLQKKTDPYNWQSGEFDHPAYNSWICNKGNRYDDALCINDQGGVSSHFYPGNVWLARYDNGEQIKCIQL